MTVAYHIWTLVALVEHRRAMVTTDWERSMTEVSKELSVTST
jgi:hypothetical protein